MFGLTPIAATMLILAGQTATDVWPPTYAAEVIQFQVRCHSPLTREALFPYGPSQKQIILGKEPHAITRVDLEAMTYVTTLRGYEIDAGICDRTP